MNQNHSSENTLKRKILHKSSMKGGRFIGAGTYGCVFTPPLLCKGDTKLKHGKVGKITMDLLAEQELKISRQIRKMPLAKHYFLLVEPESCEPAPEEEQIDPGLEQCHQYFFRMGEDIDIDYTQQIFEPFGGTKTLYRFIEEKGLLKKDFSFVKQMIHLLEAGSVLLLAGVSHFDLHPANLMVDKKGVIRILDYGNAFIAKEFNQELLDMRWKRLRFGFESDAAHPIVVNAESPELTIMNAIHKNEYTVDNAIKLTVLGKTIFKDMEKYLGIQRESSRDNLFHFFQTSEFARKREFVKLYRIYWPGFDAWSIAAILFEMYKNLMFYIPFLKGEHKTKGTLIKATLRGMLEANPRERLDCIEALAMFDPGNPWLARFGQKWLAARAQQREGKI